MATKTKPKSRKVSAKKSAAVKPKRAVKKVAAKRSSSGSMTKKPGAAADWRAQTLDRMRQLIKEADPDVIEEIKWVKPSNPGGVPTWSRDGPICTGETYKSAVKLTFFQGAALSDPARLFNASLDAGTRRAIDIKEGDHVDADAFKALVREAVALNSSRK